MTVNGNIAPKSIVIGVADPIPQRGNLYPYQQRRRGAFSSGTTGGARPKQELLPHLSEARTAKFAVKHVKYNGHDRTPRLIIAVNIPSTASVGVQEVN
jgi:hypothetical protein